jgi:hypothetical protein
MMKIYQRMVLSWVAILLVGCVAASAASAVTFLLAEWLAAGVAVTTAQATDEEGELQLEDTKVLGVPVNMKCSVIFDGSVTTNGEDHITELLTLAGVAAGEPLVGPGITCTNTANCGGTPKAWAAKLPWKTVAELMIDGTETFFIDLIINSEYEAECTVLGTKVTDNCASTELATELVNDPGGDVDVKFSDPFQELAGLKLGTCTVGGAESAVIDGLATQLLTSGTALTVSSE